MMKKVLTILFATFIALSVAAQETPVEEKPNLKTSHQIKFGASLQYDFGGYGRYDYYEPYNYHYHSYNYNTSFSNYDGPNTQVFVAYEHIWHYPTTMALGIEPKLGIVFRDNAAKGAFIGANWKFYWVDKEYWRMGIYLFTSYEYNNSERQMYVSKEGGSYSELMDLKINQNVFSFDLGFTAFQIMLKSVPIIIETNVNIIGLHVFYTSSKKYDIGNDETFQLKNSRVGGYGPKIEVKVGWQIK